MTYILSGRYGGWGLYNDQTTSGVTHTNNIIHSTEDACYHDHEGFNVTLSNNIFVKEGTVTTTHGDGTLRSAAPTDKPGQHWKAAFTMRGNIITSTGPAPLFSLGSDAQWRLSTFDANVYWLDGQGTGARLFPYNRSLADWQKAGATGGKLAGEDKHSVGTYIGIDMYTLSWSLMDLTYLLSSPGICAERFACACVLQWRTLCLKTLLRTTTNCCQALPR